MRAAHHARVTVTWRAAVWVRGHAVPATVGVSPLGTLLVMSVRLDKWGHHVLTIAGKEQRKQAVRRWKLLKPHEGQVQSPGRGRFLDGGNGVRSGGPPGG